MDAIREELVGRGLALFRAARGNIQLTNDAEANALVSDIESYPHAYVFGCIADRQVKYEIAWAIPHHLAKQLGTFEFGHLEKLSNEDMERLMKGCGHLLWRKMAGYFVSAVRRIRRDYGGDASLIWANSPSSAEIVCRFLQFGGIGPKIATMAANILVREFKIPLADYYSIDLSVDRHVKRVFERLQLVPRGASNEEIIYRARSMHPEFPGLLDFPCFEIGRSWCHTTRPMCSGCYMNQCCPSAGVVED